MLFYVPCHEDDDDDEDKTTKKKNKKPKKLLDSDDEDDAEDEGNDLDAGSDQDEVCLERTLIDVFVLKGLLSVYLSSGVVFVLRCP
jgi:hypothetical protein